ncbi:toprim domain-containing protein [Methanimicrococcus blatticola]|uniref:5S rRNA maturation endonuclease (Ribonuclease M5) n=1 Tax=Methanimicrococcus blatticola TaxID=91560 RepID=A0A484F5Z3_9EURY|nr:toprim domain-containing protein [Methanimicrococcus blatticola]MBZ3935795.1 hypothetical protein [Methanimicrococcus blatticola]MCC2508085.1 hypothetical protein [Methanimicrococcus blatticola]TDQ68835.1 5S rRNA maturation endonuclease (ribonuclease M5) [Methanimicrococcus blatticola]
MKYDAASERNKIVLDAIESVLAELGANNTDFGGADFDGNQMPTDSFLIIVEGRRDIVSLRNLGITAEIIPCANQPVAEFCENIAEMKKTVVILTDWDRKGGILAARLEEQFKNLDVPYETAQREKLLFYSKREIKDVESLYTHVLKLREMLHCGDNSDEFENEN